MMEKAVIIFIVGFCFSSIVSSFQATFAAVFDPREATVASVHDALFSGQCSCRDIVSAFLARIEAYNPQINAITSLNPLSLSQADTLDIQFANGNATSALFCIPVLLKDNFDAVSTNTTGGCMALANNRPLRDAAATRALREAGAIILGKTNMHEMALEGLSVSSLGGQTINPYDPSRTPGGSSGGTGAAIAASFAVFGTGSDTMNSLRSPASANSLFSIRPTRGLISRAGVIPVSYTQDAIGPIARTVDDLARAFSVMASIGSDAEDNTTFSVPDEFRNTDYVTDLHDHELSGIRIGVLTGFFNRTASDETSPVNDSMEKILQELESMGAIPVAIDDPLYNPIDLIKLDTQVYEFHEMLDAYLSSPHFSGQHRTSFAELYSARSNFLVIPAQYPLIRTALYSSPSRNSSSYDTVLQGISSLTSSLSQTFTSRNLTAIVYPEQRNLVVKLGAPSQSGRNGLLAALTGSPVLTVPVGFSECQTASAPLGVPIGMEILGTPFSERTLLRLAASIEQRIKIRRAPPLEQKVQDARDAETEFYERVPDVKPDRKNIASAYPLNVY